METFIIVWLILSIILGILVGMFASSKGHSGIGFFFISVLLSPLIGFTIALVVNPSKAVTDARAVESGELRKCPYCAELVKNAAKVCRHCQRDLPSPSELEVQKRTMADGFQLPVTASESARSLAESLEPADLQSIDDAITRATLSRWSKVARVVSDAMKEGGYATEEAAFELHIRHVILLVEAGTLEARGNLRWPRFSEVRLPAVGRQ